MSKNLPQFITIRADMGIMRMNVSEEDVALVSTEIMDDLLLEL